MNVARFRLCFCILLLWWKMPAAFSAGYVPPSFGEYTLGNGLTVFIAEDAASAPVRVELCVRAGYSAQDRTTTGFFPLYARLFAQAGRTAYYADGAHARIPWHLTALNAACNADAARFVVTVAPEQLADTLEQLAWCARMPVLSDADLSVAYDALKKEVMQNAFSASGFINASIDARVFADAPWQHESGIYPELFVSKPLSAVRTALLDLAQKFYTPGNSALFISGSVTKEASRTASERAFSHWYGVTTHSADTLLSGASPQKKFVFHDPSFSADLTQIIIQYTSLDMTGADIAAAIFDEDTSSLKSALLYEPHLAIRGAPYINAAAAHKRHSSRLIVQSLLEPSSRTPVEQAETFSRIVLAAATQIQPQEVATAESRLIAGYAAEFSTVTAFMNLLSEYWATVAVYDTATALSAQLTRRPEHIAQYDVSALIARYEAETPFIFVLVNSATYRTYRTAFARAGYEAVSAATGSWYSQELYKNMRTTVRQEQEPAVPSTVDFVAVNRRAILTASLANGIPVVVKENAASSTAVIAIAIYGGELAAADSPGFTAVMVNALAENIERAIRTRHDEGTIDGNPVVLAETRLAESIITIECPAVDTTACIACITEALIYGEIRPALADGLVARQQTTARITEGDLVYQLTQRAIAELYADTPYATVYAAKSPILTMTTYNTILDAYPALLDPTRYAVVVTGNCAPEEILAALSGSLGLLTSLVPYAHSPVELRCPPDFPEHKKISVQLRHLFFTDVSADKAGPRPAVLVPTTAFTDPVQYWFESPTPESADFALFNALVYELGARMNDAARQRAETAAYRVVVTPADSATHAAVITIVNVTHRNAVDALYEHARTALVADLSEADAATATAAIQSRWTLTALSGTTNNRGTAVLILSGLFANTATDTYDRATRYLTDYSELYAADAQTFLEVLAFYLPGIPPLALYSVDTPR